MSTSNTIKNTVGRKVSTLLLAGALATGGVAVAQVAAAPDAHAGGGTTTCGWEHESDGYAYQANECGYSYAEVARYAYGHTYKFTSTSRYGAAWAWSYSGTQAWEYTAEW